MFLLVQQLFLLIDQLPWTVKVVSLNCCPRGKTEADETIQSYLYYVFFGLSNIQPLHIGTHPYLFTVSPIIVAIKIRQYKLSMLLDCHHATCIIVFIIIYADFVIYFFQMLFRKELPYSLEQCLPKNPVAFIIKKIYKDNTSWCQNERIFVLLGNKCPMLYDIF